MGRSWYQLNDSVTSLPGDTVFQGQPSAFEDVCGFKLGYKSRLYGFAACFVAGTGLSVLGACLLFIGQLALFTVFFTIGLLVSLAGTGFLLGPKKQLTTMFKPVRIVATLVMLVCIAMAFMSAFLIGNALLCLIMVIIEYVAYIWYCLSYVPYARNLAWSFMPSFLRWD